jgi:hypothetical protein
VATPAGLFSQGFGCGDDLHAGASRTSARWAMSPGRGRRRSRWVPGLTAPVFRDALRGAARAAGFGIDRVGLAL